MMRRARPGLILLVLLLGAPECPGWTPAPNRSPRLAGSLVDYTHHHGGDRRIWSPSLGERRDLYVYLPPGYDPTCRYPVMIWMHGIADDEGTFVGDGLRDFDDAMATGQLPPMIIAMPDGSYTGRPRLLGPRPLYFNSNLGPYEDYIVDDIWSFLLTHYPLRPEREAHILAGYSGGGAGAFRLALKHPEQFGVMVGISPPLNIRWVDCHGRHFGNFDPCCWGWRTEVREHEVVGRFYYGLVKIRMGSITTPLFGRGPQVIEALSRENPIEMLDRFDVQPGQYQMFVAYGARDQFNIDAQVESFLYLARQRGLHVEVAHDPRGRHLLRNTEHFFPQIIAWLAPLLEPYRCEAIER